MNSIKDILETVLMSIGIFIAGLSLFAIMALICYVILYFTPLIVGVTVCLILCAIVMIPLSYIIYRLIRFTIVEWRKYKEQ